MNEKEVRLIDANALRGRLMKIQLEPDYQHEGENWVIGIIIAECAVLEMPTIDPENMRPHGKWILGEPDFYGNRKPSCSVCGEYHLSNWTDYARCKCCPNCGAMMEEW